MDDVPPRLDFENAERRSFLVEEGGERLDVWLAARLEETRGAVQRLLKAGAVRVGGAAARASARVKAGDVVEVDVPRVLPSRDGHAIKLRFQQALAAGGPT